MQVFKIDSRQLRFSALLIAATLMCFAPLGAEAAFNCTESATAVAGANPKKVTKNLMVYNDGTGVVGFYGAVDLFANASCNPISLVAYVPGMAAHTFNLAATHYLDHTAAHGGDYCHWNFYVTCQNGPTGAQIDASDGLPVELLHFGIE